MKNQYKSYGETCRFLYDMQEQFPDLVRVESIGKTWEDRDILLATLSKDVAAADMKPALFYTGTIHAREWIGNELAVKFIEYVIANQGFDPRLDHLLERCSIYMVPCANPDGFEYSQNHFTFWRKNRRDNGNGTFGVDLNRNFSVGYGKVKNTSSNVYSGPEPFSEPETRALKTFVDEHPNITIALDYHSQGNVFFPAHKFRHEMEEDGTDLNTLCANMVHEIHKVTGREYGIHRGKPPTKLISGSGREYYYSKGIISAVVEVGTRNVPDYLANMTESIAENIPALLYAFKEVENYSSAAPKRIQNFKFEEIESKAVTMSWEHDRGDKDVYYEIYRNTRPKQACMEQNLVARTRMQEYRDAQLEEGVEYYYYIRAVDRYSRIKSPFAPRIHVKTLLHRDTYGKTIFPTPQEIGYVGEYTLEQNRSHFGNNSLFIGVDKNKGICYGVVGFSLANIPENAIIKSAKLSLYPMNRVGVTIEKYGEWSISMIDPESIGDISDFDQIHEAGNLRTLGITIPSEKLTQGIWSTWEFNSVSCETLQKELSSRKIFFKISGPKELPLGRDRQMMQFDVGYGSFGGGIHFRPNIDITYTVPPTEVVLQPLVMNTIHKEKILFNKLSCGFDKNGRSIFGLMRFDLSSLPNPNETVITEAYVTLSNTNVPRSKQDIRYNLEFTDLENIAFDKIVTRELIEYVGYEVSKEELQKNDRHHFIFDSFSKLQLEKSHGEKKKISLLLHATSAADAKSTIVKWYENSKNLMPRLVIKYINKRKFPPAKATQFLLNKEKGMIKLSWKNPSDEGFKGCYVVRNRFHPPKTPYDGVKLYGGSDEYTYDNFGSQDIEKYFAIFSYDSVPNFSEPLVIHYKPRKRKH